MKKKVFYDGSCKLCRNEIQFYSKKIAKDKFEWINIVEDKKEVKCSGVSKKELLSKLHIIKSDGTIYTGMEAFREIWREIKFLKFLDFLLKFKLFHLIASFAYKIWLKTR